MAATIEPKFVDGQIDLQIDTNGSLTIKFKEVGVKNKVRYHLVGDADATYTGIPTKKFKVESTLETSSSTEQVVSGTLVCKMTSIGRPLVYVKYDNLLLKDTTNNVELKLPTTDKRFGPTPTIPALSSAVTVSAKPTPKTPTVRPGTAAPAKVARPTTTPVPAKAAAAGPIKIVRPSRTAGAPAKVIVPAPLPPVAESTPAVSATIPTVAATIPTVTTAPTAASADPVTLDDGVLTINIDDIGSIKKLVLVFSK